MRCKQHLFSFTARLLLTLTGDLIDERDKKTWQEEVEEMLRGKVFDK